MSGPQQCNKKRIATIKRNISREALVAVEARDRREHRTVTDMHHIQEANMVAPMSVTNWENYPVSTNESARTNARKYDERLRKDSARLFTDRDNISIDVLDIGVDEPIADKNFQTFEDREQFERCLLTSTPRGDSRVFVIKPSRPRMISRCQLHISEELARKLFTAHKVMPSFLDYVHAFGRKITDRDSLFGGCKHKTVFARKPLIQGSRRTLESFEVCYNYKFIVPNGRGDADREPSAWSMRQSAVYHNYKFDQQSNTWILVQPAEIVQKSVLETYKNRSIDCIDSVPTNPLEMHLIHLSEAGSNWRDYFNTLEAHFLDTTANSVNTTAGSKLRKAIDKQMHDSYNEKRVVFGDEQEPCELLEVKFDMVQDLQKFEEIVQQFEIALSVNADIITSLRKLNDEIHKFSARQEDDEISWNSFDNALIEQLADIDIHKRNVANLLRRIRGRAELLHNVLQFQNAIEVANNSHQKAVFLDFKRRNSELMTKNSEMMTIVAAKSARDAVSVKIMTIVALLYLPATFVAVSALFCLMFCANADFARVGSAQTFLQSGILSHTDATFPDNITGSVNFRRMSVSTESLLIFVLATLPLTALTLGGWYLMENKIVQGQNRIYHDNESEV